MSAEDDLRRLLDLAQAAIAANYNGADFSAAYKAQIEWHDQIKARCSDPAYKIDHDDAVARLMPYYRRSA